MNFGILVLILASLALIGLIIMCRFAVSDKCDSCSYASHIFKHPCIDCHKNSHYKKSALVDQDFD
jgi:hypothetical protein